MTSITLPPLPLPSIDTWPNTPEKLRARDQEIVRCVLEAAAKHIQKRADDYDAAHGSTDPDTGTREYPGDGAAYVMEMEELADTIRALEFTHHE